MSIITYDPSNGILSDIINSGKIQIIKNERLKNFLSNWTRILNDVKEDETWAVDGRNNIIYPFLYKNSNYTNITQGRQENNKITSGSDAVYKAVYKLLKFENLVNSQRIWQVKNERNYKDLKGKIEEIIALCEQEIELKK